MAHLFPSHYHFVGHLGSHIQGSRKRYQRLHEPSAFHDRPDPLAFSRDPLSPSRGRQKPSARHLLCLRHRHSRGNRQHPVFHIFDDGRAGRRGRADDVAFAFGHGNPRLSGAARKNQRQPDRGSGSGLCCHLSTQLVTQFTEARIMHFPLWLLFALITLLFWGITGVTQKLSTNAISTELSFFWLAVIGGALNGLGAMTSFKALESGGKASIVIPLCYLYPLVTIFLALVFLHEKVTRVEVLGIILALVAAVLLSREAPPEQSTDR